MSISPCDYGLLNRTYQNGWLVFTDNLRDFAARAPTPSQPPAAMLAFGMKKAPDKLPFEKPLKKLAEGYHAFIDDLAGWRERMRAANFADKSGAECRDEMLSYYKLAMQAAELFRGESLPISFRWADSFDKVGAGVRVRRPSVSA